MTEPVHYYFAYGSNMNASRVRKRNMAFSGELAGTLHHYEMRFNKRSVKYPGAASANVMESSGAITQGVLYRLIEPVQIEMMDPFEGYPIRYDRLPLPIETQAGQVTSWVYIANEDHIQEGLSPTRWYLNHLLAGRSYLSDDYYHRLSQTVCLPDTDIEPD